MLAAMSPMLLTKLEITPPVPPHSKYLIYKMTGAATNWQNDRQRNIPNTFAATFLPASTVSTYSQCVGCKIRPFTFAFCTAMHGLHAAECADQKLNPRRRSAWNNSAFSLSTKLNRLHRIALLTTAFDRDQPPLLRRQVNYPTTEPSLEIFYP